MIIAIDGPAASGKGLLARRLAAHYHLAHLDTGLLYRAVGWQTLQQGATDETAITALAQQLQASDLDNPALRGDEAAQGASKVAVLPMVRAALLEFQRHFAKYPGDAYQGSILDGRDITTTVLPDADIKFYMTAEVAVRAQRRYAELSERGIETTYDTVLNDMKIRDDRDRTRAHAPLIAADAAYVIDATHLTPDQVFNSAVAYINKKLKT